LIADLELMSLERRRGGCSQGFGIDPWVLECSQDSGLAHRVWSKL